MKTFVIDHHDYLDPPFADVWMHPSLFEEKYDDMCASGLCCLLSNSIRADELTTVYGGLGTLVTELLSETDIKVRRMGIPKEYATTGTYADLLKYYKLDADGIAECIREFV